MEINRGVPGDCLDQNGSKFDPPTRGRNSLDFLAPQGKTKVEKMTFSTQGRNSLDFLAPQGKTKVEKIAFPTQGRNSLDLLGPAGQETAQPCLPLSPEGNFCLKHGCALGKREVAQGMDNTWHRKYMVAY